MSSWRSWHRPLLLFAALMIVTGIGSAVGLLVDDRTLTGSPIWFKPFKFSLSLMMYALSLAWTLSLATRAHRLAWWAGTVVAAAGAVEMVIIIGQVFRGKISHFNRETPFDAALYDIMAVTIVVLWTGAVTIAVLLFRSRIEDRAAAWTLRFGSLLAVIGAALGFLMPQPTPEQRAAAENGPVDVVGAHSVGVPDGGPSMPLTGWSTTGGDLRIPHFVGMHALQVLPLLLLALVALAPHLPRLRDETVRLRLVFAASGTYAAVLVLITWQALRGQPLLEPDTATLAVGAAVVLGAALAVGVSLGSTPRTRPGATDTPPDPTAPQRNGRTHEETSA
ncbi:hypothetical protein [Streptomyces sp. NPDC059816]|uniref:hypothetical protein n=1 Tax=Streptomyces sp. NPDC059816 TaxID=3346960 RepID=UPI00364B3308